MVIVETYLFLKVIPLIAPIQFPKSTRIAGYRFSPVWRSEWTYFNQHIW